MAKDKKNKNGDDPVATALTAPDAPIENGTGTTSSVPASGPPEALARPARARPPAPEAPRDMVGTAVSTVHDVAQIVSSVVPPRLPAYLGGAALLVLGVVDLPVVVGGALAYEALRRWGPAPRG